MRLCSRHECQTTAGCKCERITDASAAPATMERRTMALRWNGGVLEQAWELVRNYPHGPLTVQWRPIPNAEPTR